MSKFSILPLLLAVFACSCEASPGKSFLAESADSNVLPPANFDYEGCLDNIFDNAQTAFNVQLGLDPLLNWKNATEMAEEIHALIDKSVDSFIQVCNDAVTYVHTYKHLEFICSTGFDVFQSNLPCIVNAEHTGGTVYQACFYKFQQIVQNNPYRYCE
ncbi:hypothetical protein OESDEN_11695 [Oesophagostomum dentatum]|uniref:DUF19 domain-containing protein n=1 Tax=Oesophagostomum dentatum TaxID=61180 RepID=A0A0B1SU78_OESDE|nr:hypothetical protein OESDEN_11695 [Oesophagostomum dentatum]